MGGCSSAPKKEQQMKETREKRAKTLKQYEPRNFLQIDIENVVLNLKALQQDCDQIMPNLSNDAFGHGAREIAGVCLTRGVKAFCVNSVKEGIELRDSGVDHKTKIVVFSEPMYLELPAFSSFGLGIVVSCRRAAQQLIDWANMYTGQRKLFVYVLVDTGSTGMGIPSRDVVKCVAELLKAPKNANVLKFQGLVLRTVDDSIDSEYQQNSTFTMNLFASDVLQPLKDRNIELKSIMFERDESLLYEWENMSHSFSEYLETTKVFARVGPELFGLKKRYDKSSVGNLRQCISLHAQIRDIRKIYRGEWIGLGDGWQAPIDSYVAMVSIGYADGYPHFLNHTREHYVRIRGRSYYLIGEVCTDHLLVHLGSANSEPEASVGEHVQLFGPTTEDAENLDFLSLAENAEVNPTVLICHLSAKCMKKWTSTSKTRRQSLTRLSSKKKAKRDAKGGPSKGRS